MPLRLCAAVALGIAFAGPASAQYPGWRHAGSVFVLTTPEGADLPATATVENFPLLVRLHKDSFDFTQAKPNGEDLRVSSGRGEPLAFQIDEWDAANGVAGVWVRLPKLVGNARQEVKLHWGKADAAGASDGKAVFDASNGYLSVWHLGDAVTDEVGTLESKDGGTTPAPGIVGKSRHFPGGKGVHGGDTIPNYPVGASPHTSEAWFRAEKSNVTVLGWGNEGGRGGKVRMQLRSPPHLHIDSNFSDVDGKAKIPTGEWVHVAYTSDRGDGKIYVNGQLDASATPLLNVKSPARLWIGGWYGNYDFVGDIDEVRVSKVARSADWVRLEYENQKPLQTLVGPLVRPGTAFGVSQAQVTVAEGKRVTLTAEAGGAQKVSWSVVRDGVERVVATDRFAYTLDAGRVVGDQTLTLRFKAIYPAEVKSKDVAVTIREAIPEPAFTLQVPTSWDGRTAIEVVPAVTNADAMRAAGAGTLRYAWTVSGVGVVDEVVPGKLLLKRAQNSGPMTVRVAIDNGGVATVRTATVAVREPATDAWVVRTPTPDEKPEAGQFYPRDDRNEGTLVYNGTLAAAADSVFLKLSADDNVVETVTAKPLANRSYTLTAKLKPGLVKYQVEFGTTTGGVAETLDAVGNLVCGDAYVIDGQSNAEATAFGPADAPFTSDWVRSFGSVSGDPKGARSKRWGNAVVRSRAGGEFQIGAWGMDLARRLVEGQKVPVCVLNGAVGGTRIDTHQRNPADPTDATTIYGRLLWRVREAKLTHGVRAVLWHQGENDQGADGPTGGFGFETYQQDFVSMAAGWKTDFPNVRHYYAFQIWPKSCSMGVNGSDNRLREVQRNLPKLFSNLSVISTLGVRPPGGCHFPLEGYAEFAKLVGPLMERDLYGVKSTTSVTAPDLKRAYFTSDRRDELALEFDQPVAWDAKLAGEFSLDGARGHVASGAVQGNTLTLKLHAASAAKTVTYLDSAAWSQDRLLLGTNGIAALTFCEVPIVPNP
jgi:hypothetical protein